jgi:hypothetical protein
LGSNHVVFHRIRHSCIERTNIKDADGNRSRPRWMNLFAF